MVIPRTVVKTQQISPSAESTPMDPDPESLAVSVGSDPVYIAGQGFIVHKDYTEKSKMCGVTFGSCNANHFCNGCGSPAALIVKRWDSGQLVWSKYLCHVCTDKECDKFVTQITPVVEVANGSNTDNTTESSK